MTIGVYINEILLLFIKLFEQTIVDIIELYFEWQQVAEALVKRGLIEAVMLIRVVLWLLATRLGTLLLCGFLCLSKEWPFVNKFSSMSLDKREKIVQRWLKHRFLTPIRVAFGYIKVLCHFVFFSWVYIFFNLPTYFSCL